MEDKWDNYFVVRVNVPPDVNKKELEGALKREYELREREKFLQRCITSLTISLESLSEAQRVQAMSGDINIGDNNSNIVIAKGNTNPIINNIFEKNQDISETALEIEKILNQIKSKGFSESYAQEEVADKLATKAKSNSTMMEKLKSLGGSFAGITGKAIVTEGVKIAFKLALEKAGIKLE